ncbi:MAG: anhydro-N-acetylmuramic acid kinase [Gammaproteobacteria bacterium]|nr:anhydro-N-acetylmuramic acid kinase [Gammaproteobacteria bacterium]
MTDKYIGLISGTSMDAIDAVVVDFAGDKPELLAGYNLPLTDLLRDELTVLHQPGDNEIEQMAKLDVQLGRLFAKAVQNLLEQTGCTVEEIAAIGSHGQTIRHLPNSSYPTSLQIGDPNVIAELTGITTVADFRRRDMAAGGQGAPLVPAFHREVFSHPERDRVILNLGGIANITVLPANPALQVIGFDTGPANGLMDAWINRQSGRNFDQAGQWAAGGEVQTPLLQAMLADPYFSMAPPKSTGREYFNLKWLARFSPEQYKPEDVQATLCHLTAESVRLAITQHAPATREIFVCGGGAHNLHLLQTLQAGLAPLPVLSTEEAGIHPDWVEAMCFAWLARQTLLRQSGNLPAVTGASRPVILGAIYWGG